jgi:hypothetical protein
MNTQRRRLLESKLRSLIQSEVKKILNEEGGGVWKGGQIDAFADQKQVNKLQKTHDKLERERNPTPQMVKKAWKNHWREFSGIVKESGWRVGGEAKNSEVFAYRVYKDRSGASDINSLYEKLKSSFAYPEKLKKFTIRPEYSPEQVSYAFGVETK